jgi:hypothetical protein
MADAFWEKSAVKWMLKVSPESSFMVVVKAGKELIVDSSLRL